MFGFFKVYLKGRLSRFILLAMSVLMILTISPVAYAYDVYVGTQCGGITGTSLPYKGTVYKYEGGTSWTRLSKEDFYLGQTIMDIKQYSGILYVCTQSCAYTGGAGQPEGSGRIWRYDGGKNWTLVGALDTAATQLIVYRGDLYVTTSCVSLEPRCLTAKLYRYNGTPGSWTLVGEEENNYGLFSSIVSSISGTDEIYLGDTDKDKFFSYTPDAGLNLWADYGGSCVWDFAEYNGALYSGNWRGPLYKSTDGRSWNALLNAPTHPWALEPFKGKLYVGGSGHGDPGNRRGVLWTLEETPTGNYWLDEVWEHPCNQDVENWDGITELAAAPDDELLFMGTGVKSGYYHGDGIAEMWTYDGSNFAQISPDDYFFGGVQSLLTTSIRSIPGKVTGGGWIDGRNKGSGKSFGFEFQYSAGDASPKGSFEFNNHITGDKFHSEEIMHLDVDHKNKLAVVEGRGKLNGQSGHTFNLVLTDYGEPGANTDDIKIIIDTDVKGDSKLSGGNIQIHKP